VRRLDFGLIKFFDLIEMKGKEEGRRHNPKEQNNKREEGRD